MTALNCAKCGACAPVCPVFQAEGRESMTARGRLHLLQSSLGVKPSSVFEDLFSCCLLCGACEQVCPRRLPIRDRVVAARSRFSLFYGPNGLRKNIIRAALDHPRLLERLVKAGCHLPAHSGLRLQLGLPEQDEQQPALREQTTANQEAGGRTDAVAVSYFTGCFARHIQPSVAAATEALLAGCGCSAHIPAAQHCCGLAAWSAGGREQARPLARKNIQAFSDAEGPIITSCASCSSHLLSYPALFAEDGDPWYARAQAFAERVQEFTAFFVERLGGRAGSGSALRVFYHDPCHLRFTEKGRTAPRTLLRQAGFLLTEPEQGPFCCGQGGLFHLTWPEISARIFAKSSRQALAARPHCITTTCSGCLMQYRQGLARTNRQVRVEHTAVLLAELPPEE